MKKSAYFEQKEMKCVTNESPSSGEVFSKSPAFCLTTESMYLKRNQSIKRIFVTLKFCLTFMCLSYSF